MQSLNDTQQQLHKAFIDFIDVILGLVRCESKLVYVRLRCSQRGVPTASHPMTGTMTTKSPSASWQASQGSVGVCVEAREGRFFVSSIMKGSTAENVLQHGDEILGVEMGDHELLRCKTLERLQAVLCGQAGSTVRILCKRNWTKRDENGKWIPTSEALCANLTRATGFTK